MLKKIVVLTLILNIFVSTLSQAGLPPTSVQGQYDTSAQTKFNFQVPYNQKTDLGGIKALFETGNKNLLTNGSFENVTFSTGWTISATSSSADTTNYSDGKKSAQISMTAASSSIQQSVTPTIQMNGLNFLASCKVKTSLSTVQVCALVGGSSVNCQTVAASNTWQNIFSNFTGPSSGTIGVIVTSTSNTGTFNVDDCYVGPAQNTAQVAQMQLYGGAVITGCSNAWSSSSTSFADFATQTSCSYATFGNASAPSTNIPGVKFTTLPPGEYILQYEGTLGGVTQNKVNYFQFWDGTNKAREISSVFTATGGETDVPGIFQSINYTTTQSNITLSISTKVDSGGSSELVGTTAHPGVIKVYYIPSSTQIVATINTTAMSWSGYHNSSCSWARTSASYGDPSAPGVSCALVQRQNMNFGTVTGYGASSGTSALPGIVFTPTYTGNYQICSHSYGAPNVTAVGATTGIQLTDVSATQLAESVQTGLITNNYIDYPNCTIFNVATAGSSYTAKLQTKSSSGTITLGGNGGNAIEWSIVQVSQGVPQPILNNGVTTTSPGGLRAEMLYICSDSVCSGACSGSCVGAFASSQNWFTGITRNSTGDYSITFASNMFSTVPFCSITQVGTAGFSKLSAINTTTARVTTTNTSNTATDIIVGISCVGNK